MNNEKRALHQSVHGFRIQKAVRGGGQQRPLADFLNELLHKEKGNIKTLTYLKNEHLPYFGERRAVFDIHCESEIGEKFIVEMQKVKQNFFKDRTVYYS